MIARILAVALVLCLLVSPALAQPLVLAETPDDGVYVLTIRNGRATLQPATLLTLGEAPPKPDEDPDDPDPIGMEGLTQASQQAYAAIPDSPLKPIHALVVSSVYSAAADRLRGGDVTPAAMTGDLRSLHAGLPEEWSDWVSAVNGEFERLQDELKITTPGQWADGLDAIAAGLPAQVVDDVDAELLEGRPILRALLNLIRDLGDGGDLGGILKLILTLLPLLL